MFLTPEKYSNPEGITAVELSKRVGINVETVKKKLYEIEAERPYPGSYSSWICELLEAGKITRDDLIAWTREGLADMYLKRIQSPYISKRLLRYSDMKNTDSGLTKVIKEIELHPHKIIRFIRTLNAFDQAFLKDAWEENPAALCAVVSHALGNVPEQELENV